MFAGGYTVRLYSQGDAQKHQSLCLGIYRSIDYHHGRPVYKQDGGQVYLYYMKAEKAWLIGPHIGNNYAWIRNRVESSSPVESSSSSSSSDSDSGSESKRKISSKKNKLGLEIRTPDQLETTWQYRLSIVLGNDEEEQWKDDEKLRVEPLKGTIYYTVIDCVNKITWSVLISNTVQEVGKVYTV